MSEQDNVLVVQKAFGAFLSNDIPTLLDLLSPDVDWHAIVGAGPDVPTGGARKGRSEVGRFFGQVAAHIQFQRFEPREFLALGDKVVVLGFYAGTAVTTGRRFESEWAMVFTLSGGRVTRFREYADVALLNAAFASQVARV
jgi:ketosteroid isomerase-like protein